MTTMCVSARTGRALRNLALFFCALLCANYPLLAGMTADGMATPDGKATVSDGKTALSDGKAAAVAGTEEEPEPKNWIEVGVGGLITNGDTAQFNQAHRISGDVFGGIQDLHYEQTLGKETQLSVDGHAIFDNNDYDVKLQLTQPKVGYLQAGFTEFRSWYDGNGGFFSPHHTFFSPAFPEMHIDRGEAWIELGLRLPDWPEITIRYSHLFRDGQKDSTIWGDTTLTGLPLPSPTPPASNAQRNPTRKIAPAYRDIDETRDIFTLDATKNFGNTDVGLGMRYEHDDNDNRLQLWRGAGQFATILPAPPAIRIVGPRGTPAAERFITQHDTNDVDLFSGHATTETRVNDWLWVTGAYSYTTLGSDLGGSRVIGTHYNSMFGEPVLTLQGNDHEILNLAGTSEVNEHVFNANALWMPLEDLHAIFGFRYTHEETESDSTFLDSNTAANVAPFTASNPRDGFHHVAAIPKSADTSARLNNFAERLELRYTGIANWLFYLEGEWDEEFGDVHEHELGGALVAGVPTAFDQGSMNKDNYLLGQKYTAGATWYPMTRLNLAAQYYHKIADYDNDFHSELATPTDVPAPLGAERNQRLLGQDWHTDDVNVRITVRPKIPTVLGTLALVSRYDFICTSAEGKWGVSPAGVTPSPSPAPPAVPTGTTLAEERSGVITKHVFSESVSWNPMARLYLQANFSYVLNQTKTPADNIVLNGSTATALYTSPTVTDFRNDYWTVTGGAGYALDDKTDLRADYTFYRANDYFNNAQVAQPYGMGATEHTVSVTATREIFKNLRLLMRYGYFTFEDQTSGNHNNYEAHSIYSGLQFRF